MPIAPSINRIALHDKIVAEGNPPYYIKFPKDMEGDRPSFHIHIDAQAPIPVALVKELNNAGFFADDFAHGPRLMGADGDPNKAFPHDEPINHMTFKTESPADYYSVWEKAREILHRATCLAVEVPIADAVRSNNKETARIGLQIHQLMPYIKELLFTWNSAESVYELNNDDPAKAERTMAAISGKSGISLEMLTGNLKKLGLIGGDEINSWALLAQKISAPAPHVYYLEGEFIPFDKAITSPHGKTFNQAAFEKIFPKIQDKNAEGAVVFSWEADQGIVRQSIFTKLSKRRLKGPDKEEDSGIFADKTAKKDEELARNREVHISLIEGDTDPRILEIMGHLGYSAPFILKYTATEDGKDVLRDAAGKPVIMQELPFTVQNLSCQTFNNMVAATVLALQEIGGFIGASLKVEPVLTFEITQGLDYNIHMPPVLEECDIRPDIAARLQPRKIGDIDLNQIALPPGFALELSSARARFTSGNPAGSRKGIADQSPTRLVTNKELPQLVSEQGKGFESTGNKVG